MLAPVLAPSAAEVRTGAQYGGGLPTAHGNVVTRDNDKSTANINTHQTGVLSRSILNNTCLTAMTSCHGNQA